MAICCWKRLKEWCEDVCSRHAVKVVLLLLVTVASSAVAAIGIRVEMYVY